MSDQHGAPRFEKTDIEPRAVVRFGLALTLAVILASAFLVAFMRFLGKHAAQLEPAPAPLAMVDPNRKPPAPRLQEQPFLDIDKLNEEQRKQLEGYGWVDKEKGIVHIAIDEAMRRVAEKGLPTRGGAQP
jgi:hypothetical protein